MRGMALMKKIPTFDDLVFLPGTLTRFVIEGYREKCETKTVVNSFSVYMGELTKAIPMIKKSHACSSVTIIQLQDIYGWAEMLSEKKEHKVGANSVMRKCKDYIKLIKGE